MSPPAFSLREGVVRPADLHIPSSQDGASSAPDATPALFIAGAAPRAPRSSFPPHRPRRSHPRGPVLRQAEAQRRRSRRSRLTPRIWKVERQASVFSSFDGRRAGGSPSAESRERKSPSGDIFLASRRSELILFSPSWAVLVKRRVDWSSRRTSIDTPASGDPAGCGDFAGPQGPAPRKRRRRGSSVEQLSCQADGVGGAKLIGDRFLTACRSFAQRTRAGVSSSR